MKFEVSINRQEPESVRESDGDGEIEPRPHPDFASYSTKVDGFHRRPRPLIENFDDSILRMEKEGESSFSPHNRTSTEDFVEINYDDGLFEVLNYVDNNLRDMGYNSLWTIRGGSEGEKLDNVLSATEESIELGFSIESEDNDIWIGAKYNQEHGNFSPYVERAGKPEYFTWSYTDEVYTDVCEALEDADVLQDSNYKAKNK